jgi:hypothetical protein
MIMHKNIFKFLFSILFILFISNTWADSQAITVEGVTFAASTKVAGKTLVLNGAGKRVKFFHDVYALGLYVPSKSQSPDELVKMGGAKLIQINMLRNVEAKSFVKALEEGLDSNNSKDTLESLNSEINQLSTLMMQTKNANKGDVLKLEFNPATGTQIYKNNTKIGKPIGGGATFYSALLNIWLGKHSVDSDLKISLEGE